MRLHRCPLDGGELSEGRAAVAGGASFFFHASANAAATVFNFSCACVRPVVRPLDRRIAPVRVRTHFYALEETSGGRAGARAWVSGRAAIGGQRPAERSEGGPGPDVVIKTHHKSSRVSKHMIILFSIDKGCCGSQNVQIIAGSPDSPLSDEVRYLAVLYEMTK